MKLLRKLARQALFGGPRLRAYEQHLLHVAADALPEPDRSTLRQQVAARETVQRSLNDRMVQFHFGDMSTNLPRLSQMGEEDCLLQVRYKAGSRRGTVAVVAHRGLLSTLEFKRPPSQLAKEPFDVIEVVRNGRYVSVGEAADRLEHGKQ